MDFRFPYDGIIFLLSEMIKILLVNCYYLDIKLNSLTFCYWNCSRVYIKIIEKVQFLKLE